MYPTFPPGTLHDARVLWSLFGVLGIAIGVALSAYAAGDRRDAIRGSSCRCGWAWRWLPRYLCVDRDNARDVQSWTSLRRNVADVIVQAGMFGVRIYAVTWREPTEPDMIYQRWLGGWVVTGSLMFLAVVGVLDFVDRRRLVARLSRHPDGACANCGCRTAEDYLFCPHCGLGLVDRP